MLKINPVQMGLSENSVPLNPMVNDHYPYEMAISLGILTQHFQTNPNNCETSALFTTNQSIFDDSFFAKTSKRLLKQGVQEVIHIYPLVNEHSNGKSPCY